MFDIRGFTKGFAHRVWAGLALGSGWYKENSRMEREDFYNAKLWTILLRRGRSSFNADGSGRMLWRKWKRTKDAVLTCTITHSGLGCIAMECKQEYGSAIFLFRSPGSAIFFDLMFLPSIQNFTYVFRFKGTKSMAWEERGATGWTCMRARHTPILFLVSCLFLYFQSFSPVLEFPYLHLSFVVILCHPFFLWCDDGC